MQVYCESLAGENRTHTPKIGVERQFFSSYLPISLLPIIEAVYISLSRPLGVAATHYRIFLLSTVAMPPNRRSQGPPPPIVPPDAGSVTPGQKRKRILTARAKAIEDEARNRDTRPTAPVDISGRATPRQRRAYSEHLDRKKATADRVRAQKRREEEE